MSVVAARISETPITLAEVEGAVGAASHGAIVSFAGVVRDHDGGRTVTALSYSAHPSAEELVQASADRILARYPGIAIAAVHRVGDLVIGDLALACAVGSAHRGVAFDACRDLVDDIKATVPIWKHQLFADGTDEWVGAL